MIKPSKFSVAAGGAALIAGTVAVSAAQMTLAQDLQSDSVGVSTQEHLVAKQNVNRSAKSDRLSSTASATPGTTMTFQSPALANTLIVTRIPSIPARPAGSNAAPASNARPLIACEPPVSVLTDVAKVLGPGRCVT